MNLYTYNLGDIEAEAELSAAVPDLPPDELEFWHATMAMNERGVVIDLPAVESAIAILEQAYGRYNTRLEALTGGAVKKATQGKRMIAWLKNQGIVTKSLDEDHREKLLARTDLTPEVSEAIAVFDKVNSAGVKKVYAMKRRACRDGRVKDLFIYHGARTGRDTGADVQPQNLVKAGVKLRWCAECGQASSNMPDCQCPYCKAQNNFYKFCKACNEKNVSYATECCECGNTELKELVGWSHEATDDVIQTLHTRSLAEVERVWGDAALAISGCIRGLFVADTGKELICSDYSSIEAVVTAMLAGEEWRIEAFRQKKDIYLTSAAKITGHSYEWYMENGGKSHPDRQKVGKPAELALGFSGFIGAWRQFDKSDNWTDDQVKKNINAWREASPMIVELWGGQKRGKPWENGPTEFYGLEGAAIKAVMRPGETFNYRLISYVVENEVLFAILPSGRRLAYHKPRLRPSTKREGELQLSYMTWNSNPKMGALGWVEMETYGGRLTENVVQAVARDIMAHAVPRLERAGYPVVLRVHDEVASEVPIGYGSIEEFERIMADLPEWAKDWPIRAAGGWRGKRYRKD
jgi:DNA polymerase